MNGANEIERDLHRAIRAIFELQRGNINRWPTWRQVAKRARGTEEWAERLGAIADMPQYRPYFVLKNNLVKLTEEGLAHAQLVEEPCSESGNHASTVALAVRNYAARLKCVPLKVGDIGRVRHVGLKCVQAFFVEMDDTHLQQGTPVDYHPDNGGARSHGTIVGQDLESGCVYVAMDTDVGPENIPGQILIDRGFMLNKLAESIEGVETIPPLVAPLLSCGHVAGLDVFNALDAAQSLASAPYTWTRLLWGPPGAGKTFAIARFVAMLLRREPSTKILLTAPSNLAVDVLVEEMISALNEVGLTELITNRKILRYGYPEKPNIVDTPDLLGPEEQAEIAGEVRTWSRKLAHAERQQARECTLAELRAGLLDAQERLKQAVREHVSQASVVATSTHLGFLPCSPIGEQQWSFIAIDEVTMVPAAVCYYLGSLATDAFLLVGDPRQLGPVAEAEERLPDNVIRWMATDIYEFAGASTGIGCDRKIDENHPLLLRITEQRRCGRLIWREIENHYPGIRSNIVWNGRNNEVNINPLAKKEVVLIDTGATKESRCLAEKGSWWNPASAELAVELAISLLGDHPESSIAIITPFRAQAILLRRMLRSERAACEAVEQIQAGTVHQFQGSAADIVIFDVVEDVGRSGLTMVLTGDAGIRLTNVAISRARYKLITIASKVYHEHRTRRDDNPLLWQLIVDRTDDEIIRLVEDSDIDIRSAPRYESSLEAVLAQSMGQIPGWDRVISQYIIRDDNGKLISRADFAIPEKKYALYVDGSVWHLCVDGWRRDQRLRGKLRDQGWTVRVIPGYEIERNPSECVSVIERDIYALRE